MVDQHSPRTMLSLMIYSWKRKICEVKMRSMLKNFHWKNLSEGTSKVPCGDFEDVHIKSGVSIFSLMKISVSHPSATFIFCNYFCNQLFLQLFLTCNNNLNRITVIYFWSLIAISSGLVLTEKQKSYATYRGWRRTNLVRVWVPVRSWVPVRFYRWRYSATKTFNILQIFETVGLWRFCSLSLSLCQTFGNGVAIQCNTRTPKHTLPNLPHKYLTQILSTKVQWLYYSLPDTSLFFLPRWRKGIWSSDILPA